MAQLVGGSLLGRVGQSRAFDGVEVVCWVREGGRINRARRMEAISTQDFTDTRNEHKFVQMCHEIKYTGPEIQRQYYCCWSRFRCAESESYGFQ